MGGTESLYGEPLEETGRRLRAAVQAATGLSVSIGGGTSKLVAKVAVEVAKPGAGGDGVHVVPPGTEEAFMTRFALGDLPFVGPKLQERLARNGLRTVADARAWDEEALSGLLGARTGRWLWAWVRGIDDRAVAERAEQKSVGREDTFPRDLHDDVDLERELLRLVGKVCADLRGDGLRARTITVKVRDADFVTRQAARTLPAPVESDRAVGAVARELFQRLRRTRRVGVRLVGVTLSQFGEAAAAEQLALFDDVAESLAEAPAPPVESERDRRLAHTLDAIRERFGREMIGPAALRPPARRGEEG
jgi:DNA polymerase-4